MPEIKRIARGWVRIGEHKLINFNRIEEVFISQPSDVGERWVVWIGGGTEIFETESEARAFLDEIVRLLK